MATSVTDTDATITWTTNEASDSQVDYGPTTSYGSSTTLDAAMVTSHSVPITGLTGAALYHYVVKSKDAAGNPQTSADNTFTTTAGPAVDLLTSLIGYWKLDEASGVRADSSGGGNDLSPQVAFATSTSKAGFNLCPHFVADANYLAASNATFAQMGASVDYTMAAWIQIEDKTVDRTFISKAGTGPGGTYDEYVLSYEASQLHYTVQGTSASYYHVTAADVGDPLANTWYLVIIWHNTTDSTIHIQVNNGTDNSFTLVEPPGLRPEPFRLGCYGAGLANLWFGLIDEVAVWQGRLLDATERAALWAGGAGKPFDTW